MKYLLLVLSLIFVVACEEGASSKASAPKEKELMSLWESEENYLDLRGVEFTDRDIIIPSSPGAFNQGCYCDLEIVGDDRSGTFTLRNCVQYNWSYSCNVLSDRYEYTNEAGTLRMCRPDGRCEVFQ